MRLAAHEFKCLEGESEHRFVVDFHGLGFEGQLHLIERVDVSDLPASRFLAGEPHAEECESVAGYAVERFWLVVRARPGTLLKIEECKIVGAFQVPDRFDHIVVSLTKVHRHINACGHGLALDDFHQHLVLFRFRYSLARNGCTHGCVSFVGSGEPPRDRLICCSRPE
ncbi:hypothetical protein ALP73_200252 [Pseudomonas coronafaciens pv. garcae]|nr:hypothetical protein ALP73_200252 [Pseudomonas coronafaciens pv. garcae]